MWWYGEDKVLTCFGEWCRESRFIEKMHVEHIHGPFMAAEMLASGVSAEALVRNLLRELVGSGAVPHEVRGDALRVLVAATQGLGATSG